jgi:hypothetical protein
MDIKQQWVEDLMYGSVFPQSLKGGFVQSLLAVDSQLAGVVGSPLVTTPEDLFTALYENAAGKHEIPAAVFR